MQYLECIHCHKRFPANNRHRAAIGRKVRCTKCWKSFPIIVYEVKISKNLPMGEEFPEQNS